MRSQTVLALLAVAVLAGCAGPLGGGPAGTDTVTPVSPQEPTADPPAAATDGNTVAYSELTGYQQTAFEQAKFDGSAQFVPNTSYVDEGEGFYQDRMTPFETHEFVRFEGTYYRIDFRQGTLYASYGVTATPASPDGNATVVGLAELPEDVRDEVREAVENGRYSAPFGKWDSLPEPLSNTEYVRYGNETYRMSYVVGDNWAPLLTVEKVP